jgi:DUF971 family protein
MMAGNRTLQPSGIKIRKADRELHIEWRSGEVTVCSFVDLRNNCPCAECRSEKAKGTEQLLDETSGELRVRSQAELTITNVQLVGNYALQLEWSDGHTHGLYTWSYLREMCADAKD